MKRTFDVVFSPRRLLPEFARALVINLSTLAL